MKPPETQTQQNSGAPDLSTPSSDGLVSAGMHASATSTEPTVPEPQPRPSESVAADMEARSGFITSVHQYIRDNIQFADQKAAFFFAGTTALLALLYKLEVTSRWLKPILAWNVVDLASMVAVVGLGVGSMFALAVVVPRLPGSRRGMIF